MPLTQRLQQYIQDRELIRPGDTVVVGVSGGPDSIALLNLLYELRHDLGVRLHVAHYNHRWRDDADDDAAFVRHHARQRKIPCTVGQARARASKSDTGSLEEKARLARLTFFKKILLKTKADRLALAHTRDDLAETVLMRIIRGTGLQGLRAIQPQRTVDEMTVIRPLLGFTKKDLLAYLKKHRLEFREDPTNHDPQFLRNRVRGELLPLLRRKYNPQIDEILVNLNDTVAEDFAFLSEATADCFGRVCRKNRTGTQIALDLDGYRAEPPALRRMLLRQIYKELNGNTRQLTRAHVQTVVQTLDSADKNPSVTWPGGITITRSSATVTFRGGIST